MPSRPLFGHVYVIDCHYDHADRAYWQCYRQGHFPGNPCCIITARRHFRQDIFGYYSHVGTNGETLISTLMMPYCTHYHTRGMIYQYRRYSIRNIRIPEYECTVSRFTDKLHVCKEVLLNVVLLFNQRKGLKIKTFYIYLHVVYFCW